ncbi:MAG: orotidine-5'-phosphate decarboxylase [Phycisphaerales bacterium]|nr:orotidine-5'-phosphate decarboxylase [Phycisphaerales bacterium]
MPAANADHAAAEPALANFADRLHEAISRAGTPACVGLDPVYEKLPPSLRRAQSGEAEAILEFCTGVIDAIHDIVPVVKPQSACFERYGQAGVRALRRTIQAAHNRGMLVVLDAKRGDIGVSAEHYAQAAFGGEGGRPAHAADAVTLNGYLGPDTIEPFLARQGRGVFVLVRTSNPGSDAVQSQRLADGRTVAELMADQVAELGRAADRIGACGLSSVGAVVGATKSAEAGALRARMPETTFLVPGYGAQGGTLDDLKPMLRSTASAADSGVIVNASRSVLYPTNPANPEGSDYRSAIRDAARRFADELRSLFA